MEDEGNEESVEQLTDGIRMGDGGGIGWMNGERVGGRWAASGRRVGGGRPVLVDGGIPAS
jgi:hypothetical protein